MSDFTRTWFDCADDVLKEHANVEVRQRYLYVITKDNCIVIVSRNGDSWQFPGGHPEGDETWQETLVREVYEESGVMIEDLLDKVEKLGYYLIEEGEEKYLQERYILFLDRDSAELDLATHERADDHTEIIKFVKAVPISELSNYVTWILEADDWKKAVEMIN